ncbi:hypothetical protein [Tabrizicola sp.]|uniref:hypothetical protein n=1 Tax=Tabrizicola sp. TaxID=2005166 RepID=UPI001A4E4B38|nr:hypothetical protein [Tabrizicola sp.]MBL9063927.1 hypothetical protein [Tabrizicola sp.]
MGRELRARLVAWIDRIAGKKHGIHPAPEQWPRQYRFSHCQLGEEFTRDNSVDGRRSD